MSRDCFSKVYLSEELVAGKTKDFVEDIKGVLEKHKVQITIQGEIECPEYHGEYDEHYQNFWMLLEFKDDPEFVLLEDFNSKECKVNRFKTEKQLLDDRLYLLEMHKRNKEHHAKEEEKLRRELGV